MPRFIVPFGYETVWDYNEFRSPERPSHNGIDFGPGRGINGGEGIAASGDGIVLFAGWGGNWGNSPGFGNLVVLDHGDGIWTLYAHMRSLPNVQRSDRVSQGHTLGYVGDTGNARGKHLHWEVWVNERPINPRRLAEYNINNGGSNKIPPSNEVTDKDSDMDFFNLVGEKGSHHAGTFAVYRSNKTGALYAKRLTTGVFATGNIPTLPAEALDSLKGIFGGNFVGL